MTFVQFYKKKQYDMHDELQDLKQILDKLKANCSNKRKLIQQFLEIWDSDNARERDLIQSLINKINEIKTIIMSENDKYISLSTIVQKIDLMVKLGILDEDTIRDLLSLKKDIFQIERLLNKEIRFVQRHTRDKDRILYHFRANIHELYTLIEQEASIVGLSERHVNVYDSSAKRYDLYCKINYYGPSIEKFIERMELNLPSEPLILDAGCGTGLFIFALLKKYPRCKVIAFDYSDAMLHEAMKKALALGVYRKRLFLYQGDIQDMSRLVEVGTNKIISLDDNLFDLIVTAGALEHVNADKAMKELVRVLKKGGKIMNAAPKETKLLKPVSAFYGFKAKSLQENIEMMQKNGLKNIRTIPFRYREFTAWLVKNIIIGEK